jgi:hypothetical protein
LTSAAQFQAKVTKGVTNLDRLDSIVNGGPTVDVTTDNGVVPSLAKLASQFSGWSPVLSPESDGTRRVLKIVDWITAVDVDGAVKPPINKYLGSAGLVDTAAAATDFGLPGAKGDPGAAGNVAGNLAQLKAAATTNVTMLYSAKLFTWTTGNFTGLADDVNVIKSDANALSVGAWVSAAYANATAALVAGGAIDNPAVPYLPGSARFAGTRGNVHLYDTAIIGTTDLLTNGNFAGFPATGWTLSNFDSNNLGITHAAGSIGSAKRSVTVAPYTLYLIRATIQTTSPGDVTFYLAGRGEFNEDEGTALTVGTVTLELPFLTGTSNGDVDFEFRTVDTAWAGKLISLALIQVQQEAPYDFFSMPSDNKTFNNLLGMKFGRFLAGNIGIGDRQTNGLVYGSNGAWNVALGSRANASIQNHFENTAIGGLALEYNQTDRATAVGYSALRYNTFGIENSAFGYKAFGRNSVGNRNTGVGFHAALYSKTGSSNTVVGDQALYYSLTGNFNVAVGDRAGLNGGGDANVYLGALSGPFTAGEFRFTYDNQVCVGPNSKAYGDNAIALGSAAQVGTNPNTGGVAVTDGGVALGAGARALNQSISVGTEAGANIVGTQNTIVGHGADGGAHSNTTTLGFGASSSGNNQVTLGNGSVTAIRAAVTSISAISDARDKEDISYISGEFASSFILSLEPARWTWAMRDGPAREGGDYGFIAQDLLAAQTAVDADWLSLVNTSDPERLEATPGKLVPILVAALKDALIRIENLEANQL